MRPRVNQQPSRSFVTATDLFRFFHCPHWPYWERFGNPEDRRPLSAADEERLGEGLSIERALVRAQYGAFREVRDANPVTGFARTLALMREGVDVIYQGWLLHGHWLARPDVLKRHEGKSGLGDWYYLPVDIKRAHELRKEHLTVLTFYAVLLEVIQKRFPAHPAILNADHQVLTFDADTFLAEFHTIVGTLERVCHGECPEPVYRKACEDTSPWGRACFRLAKEHDDIALIFNVDIPKLRALRALGIRTVEAAAEMDPTALEGTSPLLTLRALQAIQRQAASLSRDRVIIRRPWTHETQGMEIYFDIESHPPTDTDYLYGFWLPQQGDGVYQAFVAEKPEDEKRMWKAFLAWLPSLPDIYTVYHYASYESERLLILARRYGDEQDPWLRRFHTRLVDLKEKTREHAVFPLYFYSLKNICKFLGFSWSGEVQSGGASIGVYERWLATRRPTILTSLLQYNRDDVWATAFLHDWLRTCARAEQTYAKPYPWQKTKTKKV